MRKIIVLFVLVFALTSVGQSQITITVDDISTIGAVFNQRTDNTPIVVPGGAGASQIWDMSDLNSHDTTIINVVAPLTLPFGNRFITANIGMTENDTVTNYFFNKNANCINSVGFTMDLMGNGDTLCMFFTEQDTMLTFPSTFNTSFVTNVYANTKSRSHLLYDTSYMGTAYQVPVDSVRIVHIAVKSSVIDGWGTLILPNGSVDALRQSTHEISIDSTFGYINFPPFMQSWFYFQTFSDTVDMFIYWTKYAGNAIVSMDFDSATMSVNSVDWLYISSLNVPSESDALNFNAYPNPANSFLKIEAEGAYTSAVITDITGKIIRSEQRNGNNNFILNTETIQNGIYFLSIRVDNMQTSTKKIIIQH